MICRSRLVVSMGLILMPLLVAGCSKEEASAPQDATASPPASTAPAPAPVAESIAPAKEPNAVLRELTDAEKAETLASVQTGCNFEIIGSSRPKAPVQATELAGSTFAGWIIDAEASKAVEQANLRLVDTQSGRAWIAPIDKLAPRADVAKHFGIAGRLNAQYSLVLDLQTLPKTTYSLSIDFVGNDKARRSCVPKINQVQV